jgi:hypothetical protein
MSFRSTVFFCILTASALLAQLSLSAYAAAASDAGEAHGTTIQVRSSQGETGTLEGVVKDEKGEPLYGANLIIRELSTGCSSGPKGTYTIKNIKPGEYRIEVSFVGYEKVFKTIRITAGAVTRADFTLVQTSFQIGGIEVVATADLIPREVNTQTKISGGEIEHFQASSLKDVLDLVPGVSKTSNPGLSKTTQVALRGNDNDNLSTFGTLVVIDGAPMSNNANLQFERPVGSTFGTSNVGSGVDLRLIPADNIQNIEVITGLPSAKYGDVTSGVINIKTKLGVAPKRFKIKNNPDTREGNFEGGFKLGRGAVNYNINVAQSSRDVRVTGDEYMRVTGQTTFSNHLLDNLLTTNNKIMVQRILDEEEPKGDMLLKKNYNRGYTLSYSSWGDYKFRDGISALDYSMYLTFRRENSMKSRLITDYVILASGDTLNSYIGKSETKGKEWTLGGRLEYASCYNTGTLIHKLLAGFEPQYNANTGEGYMIDSLLNIGGAGSGTRSYSFDDIPGQFLLGLYLEDKITGHFVRDFNLTLGSRLEMYRPHKINLSGLWGDGDFIASRNGTYLNPRLNLMIYLSRVSQLRVSAGTSSKSPSMSVLYPPTTSVIPWRNPVDGQNYYFKEDRWVPDLKGYREGMLEVSYDHKPARWLGLTVNGYLKKRTGNPTSYDVPVFAFVKTGDSRYRTYFVDRYSKYDNTGKTETKGLEFSARTSKIEALNTEFTITGSYTHVKNPSTGFYYDETPNGQLGEFANFHVPSTLVDTLLGLVYPRSESWNDRLQINYSFRYTHPALGLWITLRAEQFVYGRNQTISFKPFDATLASPSDVVSHLFDAEIKTKPVKWLLSFNMSKSLFKGAEISFYVNNFLDDPAIREYYINPTTKTQEVRNPELFYGIEFSMMFDRFHKKQ